MLFQRNLAPADAGDGVSTYLALTFGTLLSSQGTDASFVLTLTGLSSGRFPSVFPTLSDLFLDLTPSQRGLPSRPLRAVPTFQTLADLLGDSQSDPRGSRSRSTNPMRELNFGHAENNPAGRSCLWFGCRSCGGRCCRRTVTPLRQPEERYGTSGWLSSGLVKIF